MTDVRINTAPHIEVDFDLAESDAGTAEAAVCAYRKAAEVARTHGWAHFTWEVAQSDDYSAMVVLERHDEPL